MQTPKNPLVVGNWYRVIVPVFLTFKHHQNSRRIMKVQPEMFFMFLGYHPGNCRRFHIACGEQVGWIFISSRRAKTTARALFQEVKEKKKR